MSDFVHHDIPGFNCHSCGSLNDCVTPLDTFARPEPGDVSLCWYCGTAAIFTETGARPPTTAEAMKLAFDPEVRRARALLARKLL